MRELSPGNSSALGEITSGWEGIGALYGNFRYGFESCVQPNSYFFLIFIIINIFYTQCTIRCETTSQV